MLQIGIMSTFIDGDEVNSVNSREIYEYLGVETAYSHWIKRAVDKYDFEDGVDFTTVKNDTQTNGSGGHNRIDFIVTMDMAKELCMVSNTEKGKEVRKAFIEVDKKYILQLKRERRSALEDIRGYGERSNSGLIKDLFVREHYKSNPKSKIALAEKELADLYNYRDGLMPDAFKDLIFLHEKIVLRMRKQEELKLLM